MKAIAFLNETSIQGQFNSSAAFSVSIEEVRKKLSYFSRLKDSELFYTGELANRCPSNGITFWLCVDTMIADKGKTQAIKAIVKNHCKDWRVSRISNATQSYQCNNPAVVFTDDSVAECAERKLHVGHQPYLLINFSASCFSGHKTVEIIRNSDGKSVEVHCCDDDASWQQWFTNDYRSFVYDPSSNVAPSPKQTVLREASRFQRVPHKGWEQPYREVANGNVWYVDRFHDGRKPHLEVFSRLGTHLGEADLEGHIKPGTIDSRKTFTV